MRENYGNEISDSSSFVHAAYVHRSIYRFPTKNNPAIRLRQGIVYDNPTPAQDRYGIEHAKEFS